MTHVSASLINNAGMLQSGHFWNNLPRPSIPDRTEHNCVTTLAAAIRTPCAIRHGASSTLWFGGGFSPEFGISLYGATKAYVLFCRGVGS